MDEGLAQAAALVADLVDRPVWPLGDDDVIAALSTVAVLRCQLDCLTAMLVHDLQVRAIPASHGASSTAAWLREHLRVSVPTARQLVAVAQLVDTRVVLRDALASGTVNAEQLTAIDTALPDDLDPAVRDKAETLLVEQAGQFEPAILRRLGQRVLSHLAPEVAEDALRRSLERQETRAYAARTLTITTAGDGRSRLTGWLDTEAAAIITAALDPLCKPTPTVEGLDTRTPSQRRADALVDICQLALASTALPDNGGQRPHLTITVPLDALTAQLGIGMLDTGQALSPTSVRRLACDAQIIPAVLGGDGAVLDLGRTRRTYTGATRRALMLRDGGCAFPGCDRPPRWCAAHHIQPWSHGGGTDLDNGVLVCGHHHRVIHHDHWTVRLGADRRPEFIPPTHIDPNEDPDATTTTTDPDPKPLTHDPDARPWRTTLTHPTRVSGSVMVSGSASVNVTASEIGSVVASGKSPRQRRTEALKFAT